MWCDLPFSCGVDIVVFISLACFIRLYKIKSIRSSLHLATPIRSFLKEECPVDALRACVFIYLPYI